MNRISKRAISLVIALSALMGTCSVFAEKSDYDGSTPPTTNEELEWFTTTKQTPYITRYALTNKGNVEAGYKGGEGFQCGMAFAISDENENRMLRGDDTTGVHYSTDGGLTWKIAQTRIRGHITGLCFYPGSDTICFASAASLPYVAGIYKSIDGGIHWTKVKDLYNFDKNMTNWKIRGGAYNEEIGTYALYTLCYGPDTNAYYPAERIKERGLWKSLDEGETWEQIAFKDINIYGMYCDRDTDMVITCTREYGISVSYDGGYTWTQKNNGWEKIGARGVDVDPYNKNHWIAVKTNNGDGYERYMHYDETDRVGGNVMNILYETYDGGESWTRLTTDWGDGGVSETAGCHQLMFSYRQTEEGQTIIYAQLEECWYCARVSYDGGRTFEYPEIDLTHSMRKEATGWYQSPMAMTKNVSNVGYDGMPAIYNEERDCLEIRNSGILGGFAMNWYWDEDENLRFVCLTDVGLFRTGKYSGENEDYEWYDGDYPLGKMASGFGKGLAGHSVEMLTIDPKDPNHCFAICGSASYGMTSTIVETWDGFETSYTYTDLHDLFEQERADGTNARRILFLQYSPTDPNTIYSDWFISRDNGEHWQESEYEIKATGNKDGDIVYAIKDKKELYMSTDAGRTWFATGYYFGYSNLVIVDQRDDYVVWIPNAGNSTLYRIDLRNRQMDIMGPENGLKGDDTIYYPENLQINHPVQDPNNYDHWLVSGVDFYTNMYGFVFETFDNGKTWSKVVAESSTFMKFHPSKPYVYLGNLSGTRVYNFEIKAKLDKEYFLDIEDSTYKPEIQALAKEGVITYDMEGNFYPGEKLTRSSLAAIICRAKGEEIKGSSTHLSDVSTDDENLSYILQVYDKGYMTADGDKFNPTGTVTFEELAEYIMMMLDKEEADAYTYCTQNGYFKTEFEKTAEATNEQTAYALFKAFGLEYID